MKFSPIILPFLTGLALFLACGEKSVDYVGATETGNTKVTGMVRGATGASAARVRVQIVPADYNPMAQDTAQPPADTTLGDGGYGFVVRTGTVFNVFGIDLETGERFLIRNIKAAGDSTQIPTGDLAPPGAVKVVLGDLDSLSGLGLYLAGTPLFVRIDSASIAQGYLVLDSVPPGLMPRLMLYTGPGANPAGGTRIVVAEDLLTVASGMVTLANEDGVWREYRRLYLNTSPTGAEMPESMQWTPLLRFPLLVRLDSTNFDFAQARDSGQDLRFANADGSPLPYEISRWDASARRAEVWVRVDTIRGNNDSQYIEMYWGNPQALSRSDGASVFDTAYGFVSVLHLDAVPASDPTRHSDATANRLHGKGVNLAASDGVEGMVGIAQRFNGSNSYIEILNSAGGPLNLPERSGYTVSAWVRADSLSARYQALVGKGGNQYNLQISQENMWRFVESEQMGVFEAVHVPAQSGVWRLLTGSREGAGMAIYVDGERVSGSLEPVEPAIRNESYNVSIGWNNQVAGQAFAGLIDEVIITNLPRGPDWIKLTFENQRRDQRLIQVRAR